MRRVAAWIVLLLSVEVVGCSDRLPGKPIEPAAPTPKEAFDRLVAKNCAGCHGDKGRLGAAPPLNDPVFLAIVPDAVLTKVVREGRPGTLMPAFLKEKGGPLTAEEVAIVAGGMKKFWSAKKADGIPPYLQKGVGEVAAGAKVFARACAGCHGKDGEGQAEERTGEVRRRIHDPAFLGLLSDQALRRLIITGRPDLGMPDYSEGKSREKGHQPLGDREVTDLAALLASWRQTNGGGKP